MTTYKLSSNENPYPPLPGVLEAAQRAAEQMNRYPDMGSAALYAALGSDGACRSSTCRWPPGPWG
jgi:histidinol-phosphate aminotransferase